MELVDSVIQYGTAVGVLYTLYQVLYRQARWRTQAESKLQTIDVTWKPAVNKEIDRLGAELSKETGRLGDELTRNNQRREELHNELMSEMRHIRDRISDMDKRLAVDVETHKALAARVEKLERSK